MSCGNGALQTRGTCWFFSIINGFLLSSAGQKILFDHLEIFYKSLDATEKAYFDDGIDAPCPFKANIIKTKRIYFYKFLDQYLCYRSGPRSMSLQARKSANILKGVSVAGTFAKAHAGGQGAYTGEELPKVLKHLGITDYGVAGETGVLKFEYKGKSPHFVICKPEDARRGYMGRVPKFRPSTYSLSFCSITIGNSRAPNTSAHKFHAITGFICDGKGYLFDSNQRKPFPCNWWIWGSLKDVVDNEVAKIYDHFSGGQINYMGYAYVAFTKNSYIEGINPVCRLKYKKTKTPYMTQYLLEKSNFLNRLEEGKYGNYKPAQIAALKRAHARARVPGKKPNLNKAFFNSRLESSKSLENGLQIVKNLESAGYTKNQAEYTKYVEALRKKFKTESPVAANLFENAKRRMEAAKFKYQKEAIYSQVWKKLPVQQRKILSELRKGTVTKKPSPPPKKPSPPPKKPSPAVSPRTARRKNIESKFANYWKALTKNNRNTVRGYIARHASPVKVPSPAAPLLKNVMVRINATKTAVARKAILKNIRGKINASNYKLFSKYVKEKNQANRNHRAAKKAA
jgi:hypothetical protein